LVENGYNILTGSNVLKLKDAFEVLISKTSDFKMNLYGNGQAAQIAVSEISKI